MNSINKKLWQAMPIYYFSTFWRLKVLTLQQMSRKISKLETIKYTQEYNYLDIFKNLTASLFDRYIEKYDKNRIKRYVIKFLSDNRESILETWFNKLTDHMWFCCFYSCDDDVYPNASILEAFGDKMGVFCGMEKCEIESFCRNAGLEEHYRIFNDDINYCLKEEDAKEQAKSNYNKFFGCDFDDEFSNVDSGSLVYKGGIELSENSFVPSKELWKELQRIFIALYYCKEKSLDGEKEYRITIVSNESCLFDNDNINHYNSIVRLKFPDTLISDLLMLENEYQIIGSVYNSNIEINTLNCENEATINL